MSRGLPAAVAAFSLSLHFNFFIKWRLHKGFKHKIQNIDFLRKWLLAHIGKGLHEKAVSPIIERMIAWITACQQSGRA